MEPRGLTAPSCHPGLLALAAGTLMGIASAVVGITIPTAVSSGGLELDRLCYSPEPADVDEAAREARES
jgi:hypothetical protein